MTADGKAGAPPELRGAGALFREPWCADGYDADRFGGAFGRYLETFEVNLVTALLDAARGRLLDAGAGSGKLTLALLRRRYDVTASDFSRPMLQIAREKALADRLLGQYVVADLQALSFADQSFDCTVCSRVLMHVADWRAAIGELCRVTRGTLILDFPAHVSFAGLDALWKRTWWRGAHGARQQYRTCGVRAVRGELQRHGFTVVRVLRSFFLPLRLHRWINRPRASRGVEAWARALGLVALFGSPVTLKAVRGVVTGSGTVPRVVAHVADGRDG